jgi:membrane associated rhomboid family serine protease
MAEPSPPTGPPGPTGPSGVVTCYRHHDRRAGVQCQRCGRPICPDCMVQASVGFQCPECVKQAAKASSTVTARSLAVRPPIATYVLIALNAAALVYLVARGGSFASGGGPVDEQFGLIAGFQSATGQLHGVGFGEWYRLFTGAFLHAGILHLGLNMFVLWIIGRQLEQILGPARYVALYIVALAAGAFAVMLADPSALTVGASGAIFGIMGAAAAYQRSRGINLMQSGLAGLIVLNLLFTFAVPGISIAGHIGGLIGGLATGWLVFELDRRVRSEWPALLLCAGLTLVLVYGGYLAAHQYVLTGHAIL